MSSVGLKVNVTEVGTPKYKEKIWFWRGYLYAKVEDLLFLGGKSEQKFEDEISTDADVKTKADLDDLSWTHKELEEHFAFKPKLPEFDTLKWPEEISKRTISMPLLNARIELVGEKRSSCLVNFHGFPMKVSFPNGVLKEHSLQKGDSFLWRPAMSRDVLSFDVIPVRSKEELTEDDIEFILETKTTETEAPK